MLSTSFPTRSLLRPHPHPHHPLPLPFPHRLRLHLRRIRLGAAANAAAPGGGGAPEPPRTLFPGGFKRPEIRVPALVLRVTAAEALHSAVAVGAAVARGVGIVVLDARAEGGGAVYEAARALKAAVGGRAYLLIAERVDVAAAVGASGVVLSDDGIPAIIARSMMMKSNSDSIYLPLVARSIHSSNSAISASSSEGADFLIVNAGVDVFSSVLNSATAQHVKIPIFFTVPELKSEGTYSNITSELLHSGASGIVMTLADMQLVADDILKWGFSKVNSAERIPQDSYSSTNKLQATNRRVLTSEKKQVAGFTKLDERVMRLIETEKPVISEVVAILRKAAPMMEEVSLLVDAASRLR